MTGPVTLRNLTAQPLTLKLIERYEAPNPQDLHPNAAFSVSNGFSASNISSLTSNFTTLLGKSPAPTHVQLHDKAESFNRQEVDVRLEPFTTKRTDIKTSERGPNEILRLTFQGEGGGRWRIDTPTPSSASQTLTPLGNDPKHEYTGIYNKSSSFLAVLESTGLKTWMKALEDGTPLSALSIPGTHNSPCYYTALPSVRCQAVSPLEQLQNGVRFFDIRVQPTNPDDAKDDNLSLVHGVFPISLTGPKYFRELVKTTQSFLSNNPSETVIMSVKLEGSGNATDAQLAKILKDFYIGGDTKRWYTEPRIPQLGEARGKIVLLRRFGLSDRMKHEYNGRGWGLNAQNWAYNTPNHTHGHICVQDFCEVLETENIDKKIQFCCDHFERAGGAVCPIPGVTTDTKNPVPPGPLFLNFLSASNFWKVGCWPDKIAAKLNPAVTAFLCQNHDVGDKGVDGLGPKGNSKKVDGDGSVGVVVCDWVGKDGDWDLVRCVVAMNSKLTLKMKGNGKGDGKGKDKGSDRGDVKGNGKGSDKGKGDGDDKGKGKGNDKGKSDGNDKGNEKGKSNGKDGK
ncbi:hypothetical protein MBLNU230_g1178t1 [Neophaeotheca triangularis]